MPWIFPVRASRLGVVGLCALALLTPSLAGAATTPTRAEQQELAKYDTYAGPMNILEENAKNGLHDFLSAHDGQTVYLDLSIVRYLPIDPMDIDREDVRASTDRFENPVFTQCWPDQKANLPGLLNFGEAGVPLPLDAADIKAGCATRVRFEHPMIESVSAFHKLWGDNRVQVFLKGFFSVTKSTQEGGKTLYTLTDQNDIPFETRLAFEKYKTVKHEEAQTSLPQTE
jgi:hypothetical protein